MPDVRFDLAPYAFADARRLVDALGVSHTLAQVLARRGLTDPEDARVFLDGEVRHPLDAFGGLRAGAALILDHVRRGSRITVHGDYDVDGVSSTAILVRVLRTLGARVDWYLPSRTEDGYGLAAATVDRLATRGTQLLVTADCAITAVDEVARARAAGMDVVVTDHHAPRADGTLPDAPIIHPRLGGNPCRDLCAAGVALKVAGALLDAAGLDPALADEDLDLVALATVADVVALHDENRTLVRQGLRALRTTRKPGLRALLKVARADPSGLDASTIGFRLAPRINAAGRIARADAGLELLLTTDPARAEQIAADLDALNHDRREVEQRIRFEAEAMVREMGDRPAYVLAGEGWHAGVIGIVAARIAERTFRPTVMIALDGEEGTGSGRSIPAFDLLAGLEAGRRHLLRHGGHRAAAGCTIRRDEVEGFRQAFEAHAADVLTPADLIAVERIDAVVSGDVLGLELAEDLARLEPCGNANPAVTLLVPAATVADPKPLGSEGKHLAFSLRAGGASSRAVRFGAGDRPPCGPEDCVDVAVRLEVNHFNGTVEPRVVVRRARPVPGEPVGVVGEDDFEARVRAELGAELSVAAWCGGGPDGATPAAALRTRRDARGSGLAGTLTDLVGTGERVLAVTAHAAHRASTLRARLGGFDVTSWDALLHDPDLAAPYGHVVALDPPAHPDMLRALDALPGRGFTHLAWGDPELRFAQTIHAWEHTQREPLQAVYRALRAARREPALVPAGDLDVPEPSGLRGPELHAVLRGDGSQPRTAAYAGRLLRVLAELGLVRAVDGDGDGLAVAVVPDPERTALERSEAFNAYERRRTEGFAWLTHRTSPAG